MHSPTILALIIALAATTIALPAAAPAAQADSSVPTSTYSDPWATETPTVPPPWCGIGPGEGCTDGDCPALARRQDEASPTTTLDGGSAATTTVDPFASITYAGSPNCGWTGVGPGHGWRA